MIRKFSQKVWPFTKINEIIDIVNNLLKVSMQQCILTIKNNKFYNGDEELNFEKIKALVQDKSKFVYLHYANAFHLPCFIVNAEGRQSVEFTSSFVIGGNAHIERVIINEQEEIDVDNVTLVREE